MLASVESDTRSKNDDGDGEKKQQKISHICGLVYNPAYIPSRRLTIAIVAILFFLYCRFGSTTLSKYLSFEMFKKNHAWLRKYARENQVKTAVLFTGAFIPIIAFMIPGAASLTLAAGTMFDQPMATFITAFASAIGACGAFLLARSTVGSHLRTQANKSPLMVYLRRHLEVCFLIHDSYLSFPIELLYDNLMSKESIWLIRLAFNFLRSSQKANIYTTHLPKHSFFSMLTNCQKSSSIKQTFEHSQTFFPKPSAFPISHLNKSCTSTG